MDYKQYFIQFKNGSLPGCLLFDGEEEYVKESALAQLRDKLLPEGLEQLNETLLGAQASPNEIVEACETLPFAAEKRLVLVRESPLCLPTSGRAAETDDARLMEYIQALPPHVCLLFYCRGNADGRKKLPQRIAKLGGSVRFAPLNTAELMSWIRRQVRAHSKNMEPAAMEELVLRAGGLLTPLDNEIAKLSDLTAGREVITLEDVRASVAPTLENTIFQMLDQLVAGRKAEALHMLRAMRERGESAFGVVALLTRSIRQLTYTKQLAGQSADQVAKLVGVPTFAASRIIKQAKGFELETLQSLLKACSQTDYAIKTGQLREDAALDLIVFEVMRQS